jgi:predicted ATP-dependent endonuclease of OLD family
LDSGSFERPPILLIDEAEQHLHQNAQGDLIRMLQELSAVQQVIYTTHSPACLPADLGNGVRFVEPITGGLSTIRHDFWSLDRNEHVGFNPLLIVMGAGAAAFSSLRGALIAEGVSDMLLLPTLIKLATGKPELIYQVSPGIATASKGDMAKLDLVASRVAYVVDGDEGGNAWKQQLEGANVPKNRIRSLPAGVGLEDLLDRDFYLDAVAELGGIERAALDSAAVDVPIKSAVDTLKLKPRPAGPIAFAEFVLGRHESGEAPILLRADKKRLLKDLDAWALKAIAP